MKPKISVFVSLCVLTAVIFGGLSSRGSIPKDLRDAVSDRPTGAIAALTASAGGDVNNGVPVPVSAPAPAAGSFTGSAQPLVTPPVPMPRVYEDLFAREYGFVLSGNTKLIKSVAVAFFGHLEGLAGDGRLVLQMMAEPVKPENWDTRRYSYPDGASEHTKSGIRLITWWREYNYWIDRLESGEVKPAVIRYGVSGKSRKEANPEFVRLAGMVLWYDKAVHDEAEKLIRKIDADGGGK